MLASLSVLLLDFGGVVIRTPFEMFDRPPFDALPRGPFAPDEDEAWRRLQAGEITERAYWHAIADSVLDGDDPIKALMAYAFDRPEAEVVRPEIVAMLDRLDQPTAVITNDLARFHPPEWLERMTVVRRFDPLIDLSFHGFLKPDPAAFARAVDILAVSPEDIVFVDDQPLNIRGGADAGMRVVHFDVTDPTASVARIEAEAA